MKILFAGRPHAIVRAHRHRGPRPFRACWPSSPPTTFPSMSTVWIMPDQPVLCGPGSGKPFADRVRFVGDQVALVVAETEQIAAEPAI